MGRHHQLIYLCVCVLIAGWAPRFTEQAPELAEKRPPSERDTPYANLEKVPGTTAPNANVELDGWAQYHDFYYLAGSDKEWVVGPVDQCYCKAWAKSHGTKNEEDAATVWAYIVFAICIIQLMYFAFAAWKATVGWEEVYVATVELVHIALAIWHEFDKPAMLYLNDGQMVSWLRYSAWLLSCPVILIHLSNLTGLKGDYSKRTMSLLVSDIGTIVFGTSAALAPPNHVKVIFFIIGLCYGLFTFFTAAKVYIEAYHTVPKGQCRNLVRAMAWTYFVSWAMFPILFILGREAFGHITYWGSNIGHFILEIFSKNLWTLLGHGLRYRIRQHIIIHGNLTKKTKINIAGDTVDVEEYVDSNDKDSDVVNNGTKEFSNRHSFMVMKDRMQKNGTQTRASLQGDSPPDEEMPSAKKGKLDTMEEGSDSMEDDVPSSKGLSGMGMDGMPSLQPGRVVLVVPDMELVEFFRQQFSFLPVPFEVYPAIGADQGVQLAQQGLQLGGTPYLDFVLVAPDFLHNRSPSGLVARLKMMGMRVCAFGWQPQGPQRELIESSGVDGFLMGPIHPQGIHRGQFVQLIARMQALKRMPGAQNMGGMGAMGMGMGMGSMPGMGMGGMPPAATMGSMGGNPSAYGSAVPRGTAPNPLFNTPPSPLGSQPGVMMGGTPAGMQPQGSMQGGNISPHGAASPAPPAAGGADGEAQMMQQLMAEINQLRAELNQN
uniref:Channelopsin 1 n=1 Tax=Dunaliella tertiolecta TaxID=3047 RepID=A0A7S3QU15_DUNTE|mmetsp:Transcript_27434/g.70668  ORF Transcript_27434/g.70668 Transcript_27434/m.70668 type:complete len:714 (+) Transcript_27434:137-2278(+)